jgi:Fe2+ or Zn2+ uptake regulation protein
MGIFIRMFCKHKWKTHTKKVYVWIQKVEGTWDRMETVSETTEILICEKCGKIHKIKY